MENIKNISVDNMIELYLNLESVLDTLAPEKIYSQEFIAGMEESIEDIENNKLKKVASIEDFLS